jgi:hypothetical protein
MRMPLCSILICLSLAAAVAAEPAQTQPSVVVSMARVRETRSRPLERPQPPGPREGIGVWIALKLQGPSLATACSWANLFIEEATSDRGEPIPSTGGQIQMRTREHPVSYMETAPGEPPAIFISMILGNPPRGCKAISRFRGQLQVRIGQDPATLLFPKLKSLQNTVLSHPDLTKIAQVDCWERDGRLQVRADGDPARLRDIELIDADGKILGKLGPRWQFVFKGFIDSIDLPRPIDDAMSLRIYVYRNASIIAVPFDLKDILLP